MDKTVIHTAATLAAMHERDPRRLDALAHECVFGERVEWQIINGMRCPYVVVNNSADSPYATTATTVPYYGASLDLAAQLEQELARRGLYNDWYVELSEIVDLMDMPRATAAQRTIAAVLAAQEVAA